MSDPKPNHGQAGDSLGHPADAAWRVDGSTRGSPGRCATLVEVSAAPDQSPGMRVWPWAIVVALGLLTRLSIVALSPLDLSHDVALYLETGRQLLEGKKPY